MGKRFRIAISFHDRCPGQRTGICGNVAYIRRQHLVVDWPGVHNHVTASFDATLKLLIGLPGGAALRNGAR